MLPSIPGKPATEAKKEALRSGRLFLTDSPTRWKQEQQDVPGLPSSAVGRNPPANEGDTADPWSGRVRVLQSKPSPGAHGP